MCACLFVSLEEIVVSFGFFERWRETETSETKKRETEFFAFVTKTIYRVSEKSEKNIVVGRGRRIGRESDSRGRRPGSYTLHPLSH